MTAPERMFPIDPNSPVITLAGMQWVVPKLGIKQNRQVIPRFVKLRALFSLLKKDDTGKLSITDALSEENLDLLYDATYFVMTRGTPGLSKTEFEEMPITVNEIIAALPTMYEQSGFITKTEGREPAGEQEKDTESLTGMKSSPTSA